jgi:N-acetyl-anhydromuramyl-L-alanine amidase AmpD
MSGQGWPDIAYHVLIGIDGTVYQGRDPAFRGDTGTSYNTTGHFLVVVEGNFEVERPTDAQVQSLEAVLAWASEHYGVSPATIAGHGDYAATSCPGRNLEDRIHSGTLRGSVEALIEQGGVDLIWP